MNGIPALALVLALLIGLTLGALGSGGSIVTLPLLVYVAGIPPRQAVPMSMVIVGVASAAGAILHGRRGAFHFKAAALFGVSGMAGAVVGSAFTHWVSERILMLIFAGLLLVVGLLMLRERDPQGGEGACRVLRCLSIGLAVGGLTGFLGVGGGFLIVPALMFFAGLGARQAVGTSLAIIALNSAAGLAGQLRYASFDWTVAAMFTVLALGGMLLGLSLLRRLPEAALRRAFASGLIAVALVIGGLNL